MAQRRMFSKSITNSSRFLMMPTSSQNLYFHLGMNADDDGFVEHFAIMRMVEAKPDDLKVLHAKGFVKVFDDRVLVIVDWKENNYLRNDRYTPSKYLEIYKEEVQKVSTSDTSGIPNGNQLDTQVRLGKVRLGKVRLKKESPKGEEAKASVIQGNPLINHLTEYLKSRLGGSLDDSIKMNRRFAHLLIEKFKKDYPDKEPQFLIEKLIDYGLADKFHGKQLSNFKYLYYNAQKIILSVKGLAQESKVISLKDYIKK